MQDSPKVSSCVIPSIKQNQSPSIQLPHLTPSPSTTAHQDFQAQMMLMLNDTFSKLSTVITDSKSSDAKTDWPKFSGKSKAYEHGTLQSWLNCLFHHDRNCMTILLMTLLLILRNQFHNGKFPGPCRAYVAISFMQQRQVDM
jgi:hypothetical protein